MKLKPIHFCMMALMALTALFTSCTEDKETLLQKEECSVVLQFHMTPAKTTRAASDYTRHVFYSIKDGKTTLDSIYHAPTTRAVTPGDGDVADGGGMADLTVFVVDANDNIVRRESFSVLDGSEAIVKNITFEDLEIGPYTIYAYANCEGNDWFMLPPAGEISFANYKDAVLKPLFGTVIPTIANGRMPLTGKQEVVLTYGANSGTVEMLRPVSRLDVTLLNKRTTGINTNQFDLGNIFPATGYVFKHDEILARDAEYTFNGTTGTNNYHPLPMVIENTPILPNTEKMFYNALIYENEAESYTLNLGYTEKIVINEDVDPGDKDIQNKDIKTLIQLKGQDKYLRLNESNRLEMVPASQLDDKCYWLIGSAGGQNRSFMNNNNTKPLYLDINNETYSFSETAVILRYGNLQNKIYFSIGKDDYWLRYDEATNSFTTFYDKKLNNSSGAAVFEFTTYHLNEGEGGSFSEEIEVSVEHMGSTTVQALQEMLRNEIIHLHLVFE